MDKAEFKAYVTEQKRIGLENSQIARKLGMTPGVFEDACKFAFEEKEKPIVQPKGPDKTVIDAVAQKPRKEKVPGIYYVPQNDDDEFMNTPIVKSKKEKSEKAEKSE